jgi:hypothetical protein
MRKNLTTAALVLALSCPAFGGIIHTPSGTQPPPPPTTSEEQNGTGEAPGPSSDEETATGAILSVLKTLLALL